MRKARLVEPAAEPVRSGVERIGGAMVDVDRLAAFGENPTTGIGDCGEHVAVAEVDRPNETLGRIREQKRRRAAAIRSGIGSPLGHETVGEKVLDALGGGTAREPGQPAELHACDACMLTDCPEQQLPGAPAARRRVTEEVFCHVVTENTTREFVRPAA